MEKRVAPLLGMVWAPLGRSQNKRKKKKEKKKKKKEKVRKRIEKREQSGTWFLASTSSPFHLLTVFIPSPS